MGIPTCQLIVDLEVEQMLRRKETILLPAGYYEPFADVGHLKKYPNDWQVYDFT